MARSSRQNLKLLFIGNSFTARNNLPGMLADLAAADGRELGYRLINQGGASLRMHWNKGEATKAIELGKYDMVVLQEQSTLPVKNAGRFYENVRLFDPAIRASGAKTALYMTWARKHAPGSQAVLTSAYRSIGKELEAIVVPVGEAWERFLKKCRQPLLHDKDNSHPSIAGTYLAACVFFATLFDKSPVGVETTVDGLATQDMKLLQKAAV
jgi:hypothetical protein